MGPRSVLPTLRGSPGVDPAIDEIEFLAVERVEHAGDDQPLDQPRDPEARVPGRVNADTACSSRRIDRDARHGAIAWIRLGQHAAQLRFIDARLDLLIAATEREGEPDAGPRAEPTVQDSDPGEARRQDARVAVAAWLFCA